MNTGGAVFRCCEVGAAAFLLAVSIAGCGGGPTSSASADRLTAGSTSAGGSAATPIGASGEPPRCDRCRITERDTGGRWALALSSSASIRLTNQYIWSAPTVDDGHVELRVVAYESDPGFTEWIVRPIRSGSSRVRYRGEPNPPRGDGIPMEVTFAFDVVAPR